MVRFLPWTGPKLWVASTLVEILEGAGGLAQLLEIKEENLAP